MIRRYLKFISATFAISLFLSVVNRVFFIIYNSGMLSEASFSDLMGCFIHGFELDASIAGYITAVPALLCIVASWLRTPSSRAWKVAFEVYFMIMTTLVAVIETADIGMFGDWLCRIDSQIYIYTLEEMLASVSLANGIAGASYAIITIAAGTWLYRMAVRRWFIPSLEEEEKAPRKSYAASAVMLLACGVLFLFIRGGVTTATANVSKAYFSNNLLLNQVAVNPVFSLMESTFERNEKELDNYDYYTSEEAERIFAEALTAEADTTSAEGEKWLKTERPDIVLVVMEGMGRTMTDIYEGTEPVAPEINRLKKEGIWFDSIYASSFRTDRGNLAIFSGFPGQPNMSLMKYPNKAAKLPGLAGALKNEGYITRFTYGGDANFTNTRAYVFSSGFEELVDEKSLNLSGHVSKWGYADDIVLDYAADAFLSRIRETEQPVFDAILTLSSHEPFEVPYNRLKSQFLNSFAFTDEMIGRFVEKLRATEEWENMLIVLIPDHSTAHPGTIGNESPERHHIPMLWLGGAVKEDMTVSDYMAQTDLAATLLGQLGIPHDEFIFSRDISSPGTSRFGYWAFKNGFGMIDENGVTIYDCSTESLIRSEGDPDLSRHDKGKAILQKTFIEIRKM
jgi:phosphoglycerol transferase MdoB-like AlkP superfamily enzyme